MAAEPKVGEEAGESKSSQDQHTKIQDGNENENKKNQGRTEK